MAWASQSRKNASEPNTRVTGRARLGLDARLGTVHPLVPAALALVLLLAQEPQRLGDGTGRVELRGLEVVLAGRRLHADQP